MKSEKGVTLISIIIYVFVMVITVAVITVITAYFYKNVDINNMNYEVSSQYTKFNSFFSNEVNRNNNKIVEIGTTEDNEQHYILFSSGNQYTFIKKNKAIYQNNVKIAKYVDSCEFSKVIQNGKNAVSVKLVIKGEGSKSTEYSTTFILKN